MCAADAFDWVLQFVHWLFEYERVSLSSLGSWQYKYIALIQFHPAFVLLKILVFVNEQTRGK